MLAPRLTGSRAQNHPPGVFVQNVLPWLASLAFHAGLLAVGLLTYQTVKVLLHQQVQTAPAETPLLVANVADGLNDGLPGSARGT